MELEKYPLGGKGLSAGELKKVLTVKHTPNLKYSWDNGPAIGRYLAELKNGRIIAQKCNKCGRIMLPPRMFCELCWRPTDDWVYLKDTGVVNTYSVCHIRWDAGRLGDDEKPFIPAVIEIDGASRGMGLLHLIGGVEPDRVKIGMKVRAEWKKPQEREGSVTDILYFKPCAGRKGGKK